MYERGYYVCVQGKQIAAELPAFIEEYNIGESVEDVPPPFGGAGGPPGGFTGFMSMLAGAFGAPGPPALVPDGTYL